MGAVAAGQLPDPCDARLPALLDDVGGAEPPVPPLPDGVRPSVQRILDSMGAPAIVHDSRQDLVAANRLGRALYSPHFDTDRRPPNTARFVFLDPRAPDYYVDWPRARRTTAAMLRLEAGRNPMDEELTALVGELSARSTVFARDRADHDVHSHRTGRKAFRHPDVGLVEVDFDVFEPTGEERLWSVGYTAVPGTPSADALALLGILAATRGGTGPGGPRPRCGLRWASGRHPVTAPQEGTYQGRSPPKRPFGNPACHHHHPW